jgi:hypothetical protein
MNRRQRLDFLATGKQPTLRAAFNDEWIAAVSRGEPVDPEDVLRRYENPVSEEEDNLVNKWCLDRNAEYDEAVASRQDLQPKSPPIEYSDRCSRFLTVMVRKFACLPNAEVTFQQPTFNMPTIRLTQSRIDAQIASLDVNLYEFQDMTSNRLLVNVRGFRGSRLFGAEIYRHVRESSDKVEVRLYMTQCERHFKSGQWRESGERWAQRFLFETVIPKNLGMAVYGWPRNGEPETIASIIRSPKIIP